jgi:heme/copper-type cytochrome/quinol oxidase subunit 3
MKRFDTVRLAMAVFIASEAVFFAFLIAAYIYYSPAVVHGPQASNSLDPARTLIFTICLLASSGTMWLAERHLAANKAAGFRAWLAVTIVLGAVFIAGQALEYTGLITRSITPQRNLFAATFFTLTGFHGLHVLCGLISLCVVMALTFLRPSFREKEISGVGAISMYWHFVDAVWIVIFSLVYLTVWL